MSEVRRLVSVIVPCFEDRRLAACLAALDVQELPDGTDLEVLVVDNGSRVSPREVVAAHANSRLLVELRPGSYAARNTGIAGASGSIIAFTDSDCRPHPRWLFAALRRLDSDSDVDAVAGLVANVVDGEGPYTPAQWWDLLEAFPQERYVRQGFGVTANLVVRRSAGDSVGWFDADAVSGGDAIFGKALTAQGFHLVYEATAIVDHPARSTWDELIGKARRTAKGWARLEHQRGRTLPELGRAMAWHGVEAGRTVKKAATSTDLPDTRARGRYLVAGLAYRAVVVGSSLRWEVAYRRQGHRPA